MKQTIEIEVPEGKKAVWKDNKVVFEDIKQELPKTWEEYCKNTPINGKEYFIGVNSGYIPYEKVFNNRRHPDFERNLLTSEKDAKAHLALMQLHRLRDCYRQGWVPDGTWYSIVREVNTLEVSSGFIYPRFLSFQSREIAEKFLNNFRYLIEQVGDLI